jgi:hypothetical protein
MQTPAPPSDLPSVGFILAAILGSLPIVGIMVWGAVKILGPVGNAFARRIGGGVVDGEELQAELRELRSEVEALRGELSETHERLDFAERLLAQGGEAARLPRSQ